jgi:hypothetical protein
MDVMATSLRGGKPRRKEKFFKVSLKVDRSKDNAIFTSTESFFRISMLNSPSLDRNN